MSGTQAGIGLQLGVLPSSLFDNPSPIKKPAKPNFAGSKTSPLVREGGRRRACSFQACAPAQPAAAALEALLAALLRLSLAA